MKWLPISLLIFGRGKGNNSDHEMVSHCIIISLGDQREEGIMKRASISLLFMWGGRGEILPGCLHFFLRVPPCI